MAILLVTYDLNKQGQDYADFYKFLEKYSYARLSESSYAISTNNSPSDIYNALFPHIDKNDRLYIITLNQPYAGFGLTEINDWLAANLHH